MTQDSSEPKTDTATASRTEEQSGLGDSDCSAKFVRTAPAFSGYYWMCNYETSEPFIVLWDVDTHSYQEIGNNARFYPKETLADEHWLHESIGLNTED